MMQCKINRASKKKHKVITKYMEIDSEGLDIQITQTESEGGHGSVPVLCANIPVKDIRTRS